MPDGSFVDPWFNRSVRLEKLEGFYAKISRIVDQVSPDHVISGEETSRAKGFVISGEETCRAKYFETVFEKSREAMYGDKYKKEGQMERKRFQESSDQQMERAQENSEGQMEGEKPKGCSGRQMERAQENSEGQMEGEKPKDCLERQMERAQENSEGQMEGEKPKGCSGRQMERAQENSEGQMEEEKPKDCLERQMERAQENSEGQMEGEKPKGCSGRQMERAQEKSEGQMVRVKSQESSDDVKFKRVYKENRRKDKQENSEGQMEKAQENYEGQIVGEKIEERLEQQTERAQYFESLSSLEELKDFMLKCTRVFHHVIKDPDESAGFIKFSVSEDFRLSVLAAMNTQNWEKVESLIMPIAVAFPGRAAVCHAFFISAAVLLSMVYQYLQGVIDRGGGKTYSSGSLEFRSTYVSIVLFQGAYVWIKFRDVASVRHTSYVNKDGVTVHRYEPRFKLPGSRNYISLCSYPREVDAVTVYHIIAFLCGKEGYGRELQLADGTVYRIPLMEEEQGIDRVTALKKKTKEVFKEFQDSDDIAFGRLFDSGLQSDTDYAQLLSCDASGGMDSSYTENVLLNLGSIAPSLQDTMGVNDPSHLLVSVTNDFANGTLDENRGNGAWGEQPPAPNEAPCGNGAPGEQPPDSSGASDEDCGDGAPGDQRPDPHRSFHGTNSMDSDYLSLQRKVNELRRKNELLELEGKHQTERSQLQEQHNKERIAELEGEVARLRSRECSRKRSRTSLT